MMAVVVEYKSPCVFGVILHSQQPISNMSTYSASSSSSIVEIDNPMVDDFFERASVEYIPYDAATVEPTNGEVVGEVVANWGNGDDENDEADNGWGRSAWAKVKEGDAWYQNDDAWGEAAPVSLEDVAYKVDKIEGVMDEVNVGVGKSVFATQFMSLEMRRVAMAVDKSRGDFKDLTSNVNQSRKSTRRDLEVSFFGSIVLLLVTILIPFH